ncbi:MAG: ABC transporter ATP-binding protein [Candidatus Bathyarchaeota archaeon]|nr:ABC transporter ATP-binding protein [Candidatus Bathyarchaeota archaeon]
MQTPKPTVQLTNISKTYGATPVLKNLNLTVSPGEFVCIRGKSGAGKTNLFKTIALLEAPTAGTMQIFGKDASTLNDSQRANLRLHHIGLVFQFFNLLPTLSVLENVELPMALAGVKKVARLSRAMELLGYFGLAGLGERFPSELSGGERQRVAVVRALVNRPSLLLADEPTSSLDDENALLVLSMLCRVNREEGVAVVLTTTDLYEPLAGASADFVLRGGRLMRSDSRFEVAEAGVARQ